MKSYYHDDEINLKEMMTLVNMCAMMVPITRLGGRPTVGAQGQVASSPGVHLIMLNLVSLANITLCYGHPLLLQAFY